MFEIIEEKVGNGYVYNVLKNGKEIFKWLNYEQALEDVNSLLENGDKVEIRYLSGNKPDFNSELAAKRNMDAKGWV